MPGNWFEDVWGGGAVVGEGKKMILGEIRIDELDATI